MYPAAAYTISMYFELRCPGQINKGYLFNSTETGPATSLSPWGPRSVNIAPSHLYQNGDFVKCQDQRLEIHRNFNKSQTKIISLSGYMIY